MLRSVGSYSELVLDLDMRVFAAIELCGSDLDSGKALLMVRDMNHSRET